MYIKLYKLKRSLVLLDKGSTPFLLVNSPLVWLLTELAAEIITSLCREDTAKRKKVYV